MNFHVPDEGHSRSQRQDAERAANAIKDGHIDEAIATVQELVSSGLDDLATLDICLWVADRANEHNLRLKIAYHLAELDPKNSFRFRSLSSAYERLDQRAKSAPWATKASDAEPDKVEYAMHAGIILNTIGQYADAIRYLERARKIDPYNSEAYQHLAYAAERIGRLDIASQFAIRATEFDPLNIERALFASNLLNRLSRSEEAIAMLRGLLDQNRDSAALRRALSGYLMQQGELLDAAEEAELAVSGDPQNPEYRVHFAFLLIQIGEMDDALREIEQALRLDPDNVVALRVQVEALLSVGDLDRAFAKATDLIRMAPNETEYSQFMMHIITLRLDAQSVPINEILEIKRRSPIRPDTEPRSHLSALTAQLRVIEALIIRETRTRFGHTKLGYGWVFAEPMIHIGALAMVFAFTMHSKAPLGDSLFFFYFTGLVPFQLMVHTVSQVGHAIDNNRQLLQLPLVTNFDTIIARAILEFATEIIVTVVFTLIFMMGSVDSLPKDLPSVLGAAFSVWMVAIGFGIIHCCMETMFRWWDHVWQIVYRFLYFASGIFYVTSNMPEWLVRILSWNPIMHCIAWYRTGFFDTYDPIWLNRAYPAEFAIALLVVGLTMEFVLRRRLQNPL